MPKSAHRKAKKKIVFNQVSLGVLALFFLVALLIISKVLGAVISLNNPYSADSISAGQSGWEGEGRLNMIVKADDLYLVSFDPGDSLSLIGIPDETILPLPFGYGRWQAGSVYNFGQSEKPPIGAALLTKATTSAFALPIAHYLILSDKLSGKPLVDVIESMRQSPIEAISFLSSSKTNLTPLEYLKLWWGWRGLRTDKIKSINLTQSNITSWELLSDGSRVLSLDFDRLDEFVQKNLTDSRIGDEGVTIGVFNATEHTGLAERVAREIANMGGRVIFTTNFPIKLQGSVVIGKDASYTSKLLARIFAPSCVKNEGLFGLFSSRGNCSAGLTGVESSRADVNVVVGEDFYLQFNRPSK